MARKVWFYPNHFICWWYFDAKKHSRAGIYCINAIVNISVKQCIIHTCTNLNIMSRSPLCKKILVVRFKTCRYKKNWSCSTKNRLRLSVAWDWATRRDSLSRLKKIGWEPWERVATQARAPVSRAWTNKGRGTGEHSSRGESPEVSRKAAQRQANWPTIIAIFLTWFLSLNLH